jgi:formylglycine-generating enzyme required for sulfatase activity
MKLISVAFFLSIALAAAAQPHDMVKIPAGPFTMESNEGHEDERPAHTVTLASFDIDRLRVSNAEFARFLEHHGTSDSSGRRYFDWGQTTAHRSRVGEGCARHRCTSTPLGRRGSNQPSGTLCQRLERNRLGHSPYKLPKPLRCGGHGGQCLALGIKRLSPLSLS